MPEITPAVGAPLLEVRDLHSYYGVSHILHGISLTVNAGEALGLLGRNGMGKSTTLRSIIGLVKPQQGEVRIRGTALTGKAAYKAAQAGIAYVPEDRGIFPNLTVHENLVMAARPGGKGNADWDLNRVLETFPRLAERSDHMGNQLSGGEQQMLTVGRALMTNPDLIMLDEATEGLAPLIRREIWRVIGAIKAAGIATIVVDKQIHALLGVTDRCVILEKGEVVWSGSSAELREQPEIHRKHLGV
ncbi:MAG: High-affinity branched-chain amino acid transport ATP-binding protein LivF [Gammaproteobacteria bacterium]|nr:High-affinity branched-chain amino acid transport ATP-binding protein LivF [Gammaproteobacteria bacterium]